jgi:hypothetical protein
MIGIQKDFRRGSLQLWGDKNESISSEHRIVSYRRSVVYTLSTGIQVLHIPNNNNNTYIRIFHFFQLKVSLCYSIK